MSFILGLIFSYLLQKFQKYFIGKVTGCNDSVDYFRITMGYWLTQDAANIAVFLPRFSVTELCLFLLSATGLGILLYSKDKNTKNSYRKSVVTDVRFATLIDLVYCVILFYFKMHS